MLGKALQIAILAAAFAVLGGCAQSVTFRGPQGDYAECTAKDAACIRSYEQKGYRQAPPPRVYRRSMGCC